IEHRAVVNSVQERLSVATAYSLRYDGEVYPAPSLISEKTPPLFRRVRIEEYFRSRYALKASISLIRITKEFGTKTLKQLAIKIVRGTENKK
ncbi:hypothetical protein CISIN_1g047742mg, partial [Citrus sinensis]